MNTKFTQSGGGSLFTTQWHVGRWCEGDQNAIGDLSVRLAPLVQSRIYGSPSWGRLKAHHSIEDIEQELWTRVLRSGPEAFDPNGRRGAFIVWLSQVIDSTLIDILRRASAEKRGGGKDPLALQSKAEELRLHRPGQASLLSPSAEARVSEFEAVAQKTLTDRELKAWRWVVLENYTSEEAAMGLNCTSAAIRGLLLRSRSKLQQVLAEQKQENADSKRKIRLTDETIRSGYDNQESDNTLPVDISSEAVKLFDSFLGRRDEDGDIDFDLFCSQHPRYEAALKKLYEDWQAFEDLADDVRDQFAMPRSDELSPESASALHKLRKLQQQIRPENFATRGEIGRGGMGIVFRVWDEDLQRELAMKVLRRRASDSQSESRLLARFLAEAQITGQLEHPGVVPVHHLGADPSGNAYFTMNLVKGENLAQVLQYMKDGDKSWTLTRVLGILLKVCETLAYAHSKRVIHRDLKPTNIMVGRFGEVYVMDWGLAKSQGDENDSESGIQSGVIHTVRDVDTKDSSHSPLMTVDGVVLGTPSYMAPEQASGRIRELGPRSDVYSIGAMLYESLAGFPPYAPPSRPQSGVAIVEQIRNGPPAPLSEVSKSTPPELQAICEKAMARNPERRYADPDAMASDLRAYLEHRVVAAYKTGAIAELRKWVDRNRTVACWSGVAIGAILVSLAALWIVEARARDDIARKATALESARSDAETARQEAADEADALERTVQAMEKMFNIARPDISQGSHVSAVQLIGIAAQRLADAQDLPPRSFARISECVGRLYDGLGELDLAEFHLQRAIETLEQSEPETEPRLLDMKIALADVYRQQLRFEEGAVLYDELDAILRSTDDPSLEASRLLFLCNRGVLEVDARRNETAEIFLEEAFEAVQQSKSAKDGLVLTIQNNLGVIYERTDRPEEAKAIFEDILERRLEVQGENHPNTATAIYNLSRTHSRLGNVAEAISFGQRAIEIRKKIFGKPHYLTLTAGIQYAYVTMSMGKHRDAVEVLEELHEASPRPTGNNPKLMELRLALATAYNNQRAHQKAMALLTEEVANRRNVFGTSHVAYATALERLGHTHRLLHDYKKAEECLSQSLKILRRSPGMKPETLVDVLSSLASVYLAMNELGKAELISRESYEFCTDVFDSGNPFRIRETLSMGKMALRLEKIAIAEEYFEEGFEASQEHLPEGHGIRTQAYLQYARFLETQGFPGDALDLAEQALSETSEQDGLYASLAQLADRLRHSDFGP